MNMYVIFNISNLIFQMEAEQEFVFFNLCRKQNSHEVNITLVVVNYKVPMCYYTRIEGS